MGILFVLVIGAVILRFSGFDLLVQENPVEEVVASSPTTTSLTESAATTLPTPCDRVEGVPERTMRWCPLIAEALASWGALDLDRLQHNLDIVDCESRGDPNAKNPISTASGLYQHITPFRDPRALKYLGRPVVSWFDGPDNIIVGVGLYVDKGPSHWPNCGRR